MPVMSAIPSNPTLPVLAQTVTFKWEGDLKMEGKGKEERGKQNQKDEDVILYMNRSS